MLDKKILYVCYGGAHINMVLPVYRYMKENYQVNQSILALTGAGLKLDQLGIPYFSFKHFLDKDNKKILEYGKSLFSGMKGTQLISEEESVAYLGLSYGELVESYGEDGAGKLYKEKGRGAFLPLKTMEKIITQMKPDLVVSTTSPRAEMAALLVSRNIGINSVCILDRYLPNQVSEYLPQSTYGTKICVPDEYHRNKLIKLGRPEHEIVLTGNPAFDEIFAEKYHSLSQQYRDNHGIGGKKVILWPRSSSKEDEVAAGRVEKALIKFVEEHEDYALIVRPHPNDTSMTSSTNKRVICSSSKEPLYEVLHSCDVVVTLYSTVGLEGYLIGKKLIQYTDVSNTEFLTYIEQGIASSASNIEQLYRALIESFCKEEKQKNLKEHGVSSANVADVINSLL